MVNLLKSALSFFLPIKKRSKQKNIEGSNIKGIFFRVKGIASQDGYFYVPRSIRTFCTKSS
jgi:hypothetical protein